MNREGVGEAAGDSFYTLMMLMAQQASAAPTSTRGLWIILGVFVALYAGLLLLAVRLGRRRRERADRVVEHLGGIEQSLKRIAEAMERKSQDE